MLAREATERVMLKWKPPQCPESSRLDDWFLWVAHAASQCPAPVSFLPEVHEEIPHVATKISETALVPLREQSVHVSKTDSCWHSLWISCAYTGTWCSGRYPPVFSPQTGRSTERPWLSVSLLYHTVVFAPGKKKNKNTHTSHFADPVELLHHYLQSDVVEHLATGLHFM